MKKEDFILRVMGSYLVDHLKPYIDSGDVKAISVANYSKKSFNKPTDWDIHVNFLMNTSDGSYSEKFTDSLQRLGDHLYSSLIVNPRLTFGFNEFASSAERRYDALAGGPDVIYYDFRNP